MSGELVKKPFDLDKALTGAKLVTRDGAYAGGFDFNRHCSFGAYRYQAYVYNEQLPGEKKYIGSYTEEGKSIEGADTGADLFLLEEEETDVDPGKQVKCAITSASGSTREKKGVRWDLIPGIFTSLEEVAKVAEYGAGKYGIDNWKGLDVNTEQSPLNHCIRHAAKAAECKPGSEERIWQLAKTAWNALAQIYFERS